MERLNKESERIMNERFGKDNVIALATVEDGVPYVRSVNAYYEKGAFYVITHGLSNKMRQLQKNPAAAISGEWFTAHGTGVDLGYFGLEENREIAWKLKEAFAEWIDNGHNDFEDTNTCILCVRLTDGILLSHGTRYEIDFTGAYEFDGEKYEKASKHQKEWGRQLMAGIDFRGDENVLDLGCGDGALTEQLARRVPGGHVLGIDASAGMIRTAGKHAGANLEFRRADINQMDFENEFDLIFSNAALHWIIGHKSLIANAFRALKAGGRIAWNFAADGTCTNFYAVVKEKMKEEEFSGYFRDFAWPWYMPSREEYESLMAPAGFSDVKILVENKDRYFADVKEMIRWLDQPCLVPFMNCLPNEKKEGFRQAVIEGMIAKAMQPDGTCFETFRRLNVRAVKL